MWSSSSKFTSRHFLAWAIENKIDIPHIRPAYVESFHGRLRDECLNVSWFWNLFDDRRKISAWQLDYNSQPPHSSLGYRAPEEFNQQWLLSCRKQYVHKKEMERKIKL